MEKNKNLSLKISKKNIFQGTIVLSSLLLAFSIFNITEITQTNTNIERLNTKIERQKVENEDSRQEIESIKEEFEGAEKSSPLDIDGRINLVVRDIQRLITSYNISSTISPINNDGGNTPTASVDPETGLRTISFSVELDYSRYEDAKEVIAELRDVFPITIDKVVFSNRNATFNFTMYGN